MLRCVLYCFAMVWFSGFQGLAGPQSLFGDDDGSRAAFLDVDQSAKSALIPVRVHANPTGSSLFAGRDNGFFEPRALEPDALGAIFGTGASGLRDLIASAEAGRAGYDAVQYGARVKPAKRPTQMTIREIYRWIAATPGQPHAIGRYQFIPPTLRRLVADLGVGEDTVFSPLVQDRLADLLLQEAGMRTFLAGEMTQTGFMNNLAKIWAGLPNSTGRSHYHGHAGNKATMTWAHFKSQMDRMFPRG